MGRRIDKPEPGIFKCKANVADPDVKVLDFSYSSDVLAKLVVDAWADNALKTMLLDHANEAAVKAELASRGFFLNHPVVLTEDEYENGWEQEHDDEVVLVLPNEARKTAASGSFTLLETAKLLMAVTPNGI
jgi:hypothetical protein